MSHPLDLLHVPATYTRVLLQRLAGAEQRLLAGSVLLSEISSLPCEISRDARTGVSNSASC